MAMNTGLIMEFKHEGTNTRKMLERVPYEKATWKPHEKSNTLAGLAAHIARLPVWVERVSIQDEFDFRAPNAFPKVQTPMTSKEVLEIFDKNIVDATKYLENLTDEQCMKPWTFRGGDKVLFTLPKAAVIRNMAFNHIYHHRGQLSVYLRLLDVPVPGMFGPSADETI